MSHLTREQILARKLGKGTATLPDGSTVAIRAVTVDEVEDAEASSDSRAERRNRIVALGMTDPKLTVEEVAAWAATGNAGDLVAVQEQIAEMSGLKPTSGKEATKSPAE